MKIYPINDPETLLDLVKNKVRKEMKEEIEIFKVINLEDLLKPRQFYFNKFDYLFLTNITYQIIIKSNVEDYIFKNYLGEEKFGFPIKTFNLMLDEDVNILRTIWEHGINIKTILNKAADLHYQFLNVIEELIIIDKWKNKIEKEIKNEGL